MSATYDVGEPLEPLEREEVDRRGIEEFVGARERLDCVLLVYVEEVALDSVRLAGGPYCERC